MAFDIGLTSSMRANLYSLQTTASLMDRTQERLSTGQKVNSALDDPAKYFSAQDHISRATDLDRLKSSMAEALQTLEAADEGITSVISLIEQARGLTDSARSSDATGKTSLATQFNSLVQQMKDLVDDAGYKGINLLNNTNLTVQFEGTHNLSVVGVDANNGTSYLAGLANAVDAGNNGYNNFGTEADIANAVEDINAVLTSFRSASASLAANVSIVTTRSDFTQNMIDVLQTGAAQLTEADTNEESVNMLALQTRQELGITALQLSSQASQSILQLF